MITSSFCGTHAELALKPEWKSNAEGDPLKATLERLVPFLDYLLQDGNRWNQTSVELRELDVGSDLEQPCL
jgi:hypothetical protein